MNEPDVVLTDVALAILAAYLGWRLGTAPDRRTAAPAGVILMGGLASAALWGAVFHAFFPAETATLPGFIAWIPVALSILVVAATLLDLAVRILATRLAPPVRRSIVAAYAASFAAVVLLVDESFSSIVRFYAPALVLCLIASVRQAVRSRNAGWMLLAAGLTASGGAALLQQAEVAIHRDYFDHNAVYHVLQGIALVLLYLGFRRASAEVAARAYATGTDRAPRRG